MSSELDNVKNQVQLAAKSIDDAAQATQTAYSNADEKKERLNTLGVHASYQGLEQACEKLQQATATLGTAHGEAIKATTELQGVESTMPIPESLPKLGLAVSELDSSKTNLAAAAELAGNAKTDAEQVGVEGIVAVCQGALDMIDTARSTVDTGSNAVSGYQKRLDEEARELTGLNTGASAPQSDSNSDAAPTAASGASDSSTAVNPTRGGGRPVSTLTTHGVTHGTVQRRAGATEGPVIFSSTDGMTPTETGQAQEYVDAANKANQRGRLSPTGRAKMDHRLKLEKLKAAAQERKRAKDAGEPYGTAVAAHLPDSTWVGRGEPPEGFGRHTNRVNSTLGSQSGCYPEGYQPTEFKLDDSWPDADTES